LNVDIADLGARAGSYRAAAARGRGRVTGFALIDGVLAPLDQARVPITDVQFTHGLGVYETIEAGPGRDPGPNLVRLAESARAIGVAMPDEGVLRAEIDRVARELGGAAWVRVNLTGDGRRQVWATPVDPARRHVPVRAGRAPHVDHPLLAGSVKHRSRGPWTAEVRRRKVDELLFVDADGRFTEGTSCAVVAVVGGAVWTAPWDGRILRSTTLERLLGHAARLGFEVIRTGPLSAGPWDALYVASTTRSLAPVLELDGEALVAWDPVGRALAEADDRP
jgi:branched-subunit amino acid aminotransferase/4-amino-4-deoxychorismate lyase